MFLSIVKNLYNKNNSNLIMISNRNFSKDLFKRPVSQSDIDYNKYRKKFLDVENKKWVVDEKSKNSGRELFYPKYGNSFWDPTLYDVNKKK